METYYVVTFFSKKKMFKSYYVVWKPYEVTTANDGRYRLNRTMQYGNHNKPLMAIGAFQV